MKAISSATPWIIVAGARVLDDLAVDEAADPERLRIRDLVGGHDPRSHRTERVEALAADPLAVAELEVACRHVVQAGVAEDVIEGSLHGHVPRESSDDDGEFRLVVHLGRVARAPDDVGAIADDGRAVLREQDRVVRRLDALLGGMLGVVAPDGHDLARPGDRREQLDRRRAAGPSTARSDGQRRSDRSERRVHVVEEPRHRPRAVAEEVLDIDDPIRVDRPRPGARRRPLAGSGAASVVLTSSLARRRPRRARTPGRSRDSSDARNRAAAATSSGWPRSPVS